jgi:hypothetical protein
VITNRVVRPAHDNNPGLGWMDAEPKQDDTAAPTRHTDPCTITACPNYDCLASVPEVK